MVKKKDVGMGLLVCVLFVALKEDVVLASFF